MKRKKYFIKSNLQGKWMLGYFFLVLLGSIIFTFVFSMFTADTLSITYDAYRLEIGDTPTILIQRFFRANWISIVFGGLAVVLISLFASHRVAGPLYRFEKAVDAMIQGRIGYQIRLRKHDEGKELAEKINRLNDAMAATMTDIRDAASAIENAMPELEGANTANVRDALQRLNASLDKFDIRK